MKKIFTLLAFVIFTMSSSAQVVSITIDTIYYSPSSPSAGDSIYLHLSGSANCQFAQQGPTFISDTGRHHTLSVCLFGEQNTPPSTFSLTYAVYRANSAGQDTLEWMFFYNRYDTLFCDTVLDMGVFFVNVGPAAVLSQQSHSLSVSWNPYASSLTLDRLETEAEFRLMDMSGRVIRYQQLNATSAEIRIADLREGIYLVYISDNEGMLYRKKIFIGQEGK
ncbi:MAG: T9SS type A sorting domain-containing protein [Bacteroidota bacterium]|nr:T9SS type A sorting domain-containing protein [Bacteroidota bacterium]